MAIRPGTGAVRLGKGDVMGRTLIEEDATQKNSEVVGAPGGPGLPAPRPAEEGLGQGPGAAGGVTDALGKTLRDRNVTLRNVRLGALGVSGFPAPRPVGEA